MKKGIIFILLIIFLLFINIEMVKSDAVPSSPASSSGFRGGSGFFGGRIINTTATEIASLEASGYVCLVPGTSISIIPIGSPTGTPMDYVIPYYVTPRTRTTPASGQLILGRYGGQTTVSCTLPGDPPITTIVTLNTITLFGTSKGFSTSSRTGAASAVPSGPASAP